jgi:hypothetical protein
MKQRGGTFCLTYYRVLSDKRVPLGLALIASLMLPTFGVSGRLEAKPGTSVPLPKGVTLVEVDRYQVPMGYPETIRWLERRWSTQGGKVSFRTVVDLPGVVAAHAKTPALTGNIWGVNVSRIGGRVEIFLVR